MPTSSPTTGSACLPTTGFKRDREPSQTTETVKQKKQRTDSSDLGVYPLHSIPFEVTDHILSYVLSPKDVTNFELACKANGSLTYRYWEKKINREGLDLTSPLVHIEPINSSKDRYLFGRILYTFSLAVWKDAGHFDDSMGIYPEEKSIEQRFPELHKLLLYALYQKSSSDPGNPFLNDTTPLRQKIFINTLSKNPNPSHLIMRALFESSATKAFELYEHAAKKNPAAASLALQMPEPDSDEGFAQFKDDCYEIAISAAEEGNYRPLEVYLEKWPDDTKNFIDQNFSYPPVLFQKGLSLLKQNPKKAEEALRAALQGYGANVPIEVLIKVIDLKGYLRKEVEALIPQALDAYEFDGLKIPAYFFDYAASLKKELKKYKEAENFYIKAFDAYLSYATSYIPAKCLESAALVKIHLGKFLEADFLYAQAFTRMAMGTNFEASSLANAAFVKRQLGNIEEANNLATKALEGYKALGITRWANVDALFDEIERALNPPKNEEEEGN